jgi:ABC-2 type transport system ATP-binding protein
MPPAAVQIEHVSHRYGERLALDDLSLEVRPGEIFALLGPNGSGKTTLFRLLSTLIPLQAGRVRVLGHDLATEQYEARSALGVVFQAPSLDRKLTVGENLRHQGKLYGLSGRLLQERLDELMGQLGLKDREGDLVETLSGGLRRRVELAKGMLHHPRVLILDEPSTGLDPGARADLWRYLHRVRDENGVTVVLTTHLLEEADRADRIAIVHQGRLVALDTPDRLRAQVGGDSITIAGENPAELAAAIQERFHCVVKQLGPSLRLEQPDGHQWIGRLVEAFGDQIQTITLGKPTLEDVFIARTGHRFWDESEGEKG